MNTDELMNNIKENYKINMLDKINSFFEKLNEYKDDKDKENVLSFFNMHKEDYLKIFEKKKLDIFFDLLNTYKNSMEIVISVINFLFDISLTNENIIIMFEDKEKNWIKFLNTYFIFLIKRLFVTKNEKLFDNINEIKIIINFLEKIINSEDNDTINYTFELLANLLKYKENRIIFFKNNGMDLIINSLPIKYQDKNVKNLYIYACLRNSIIYKESLDYFVLNKGIKKLLKILKKREKKEKIYEENIKIIKEIFLCLNDINKYYKKDIILSEGLMNKIIYTTKNICSCN